MYNKTARNRYRKRKNALWLNFKTSETKKISNKHTAKCRSSEEGMALTFSREVQEAEVRTRTALASAQIFLRHNNMAPCCSMYERNAWQCLTMQQCLQCTSQGPVSHCSHCRSFLSIVSYAMYRVLRCPCGCTGLLASVGHKTKHEIN